MWRVIRPGFLTLGGLAAALVLVAPAVAAQPSNQHIRASRGTIPLVFSAPHGGAQVIPGVPTRTSGKIANDARTRELTEMLAGQTTAELCGSPHYVLALFHRRSVDANREASLAFEHPLAEPAYLAYHARLASAVAEVVESVGGGLLIDVHGQSDAPSTIFRGTRNGQTVRRLVETWGAEPVIGASSLMGRLAGQGYEVDPPVDSTRREDPRFNGGYIVGTYGSHGEGGIDAIQLEFGFDLRQPSRLPALAAHVSAALAGFLRDYVPGSDLCAVDGAPL